MGHDQRGLAPFDQVSHPRNRDRGIVCDDQVALPYVEMTQPSAAVRAGQGRRVRPLEYGLQLAARLASKGDLFAFAQDAGGDRLPAIRTAHQAGCAAEVEQGSARTTIRAIRFMDLLQAMSAMTDDRARLRRRCRRNDLPDDGHLLLDDRRRRLPEMLLVVRPSDEAEHQDQGQGENPVDQAGDDGPNADNPERGRDEVEEDEDPDARFASPMKPLRPVHSGTIFGGIRIPEPLVRALLESRDRIARDEHDAKEHLRILRDVEGSEVDRVARYIGGIPGRAVRQELPPGVRIRLIPPWSTEGPQKLR